MHKLNQLFLFVSLCFSATSGIADGEATGSMQDITISFEILDAQGNAATQFARGQSALFRIALTNPTTHEIRATYTPPGYEIGVYQTGTKTLLWQTHGEMAFIQMLQDYVIQAGETQRLDHPWDLRDLDGKPLPPGRYDVRALLNIGLIGELESLSVTIK